MSLIMEPRPNVPSSPLKIHELGIGSPELVSPDKFVFTPTFFKKKLSIQDAIKLDLDKKPSPLKEASPLKVEHHPIVVVNSNSNTKPKVNPKPSDNIGRKEAASKNLMEVFWNAVKTHDEQQQQAEVKASPQRSTHVTNGQKNRNKAKGSKKGGNLNKNKHTNSTHATNSDTSKETNNTKKKFSKGKGKEGWSDQSAGVTQGNHGKKKSGKQTDSKLSSAQHQKKQSHPPQMQQKKEVVPVETNWQQQLLLGKGSQASQQQQQNSSPRNTRKKKPRSPKSVGGKPQYASSLPSSTSQNTEFMNLFKPTNYQGSTNGGSNDKFAADEYSAAPHESILPMPTSLSKNTDSEDLLGLLMRAAKPIQSQ